MLKVLSVCGAVGSAMVLASPAHVRATVFADTVIDYTAGDNPLGFVQPASALGPLCGDTTWGGLNPFNPPFASSHIVIVGPGGQLTLRLAQPVTDRPGPDIGVFANNGLEDVAVDGSGTSKDPAATFSALPQALVSVSGDGTTFVPLQAGAVLFDNPSNYYLDSAPSSWYQMPGTAEASFSKPFTGSLASFSGKTYPQVLALLGGSAGGKWLDIASAGVSQARYIRFEVPAGADYRMVVDAVAAAGLRAGWAADADRAWSAEGAWTTPYPDATDVEVDLPDILSAPRTITLDVPATVGRMTFDSLQGYTIAGDSTLTVQVHGGNAQIRAARGNHAITAPLSLASDTILCGPGELTTGNITNAAAMSVQTVLHAGDVDGTGSITVGTGFNAPSVTANHIRQSAMTLKADVTVTINPGGGPAGASKVGTLSMDPAAKLNLKNNSLVIGSAEVLDVRTLIKSGAIFTDAALASPRSAALGYAAGDDLLLAKSLKDSGELAGQSFDGDSVLIKYTYEGDADLDGDADGNDIGTWALNFTGELGNPNTPSKLWTQGDWDHDGDVDGNDAGSWALNFTGELSGAGLTINAPGAPPEAVAMLDSMGIAVVPEPAAMVLLAAAGMGLLPRRRRR